MSLLYKRQAPGHAENNIDRISCLIAWRRRCSHICTTAGSLACADASCQHGILVHHRLAAWDGGQRTLDAVGGDGVPLTTLFWPLIERREWRELEGVVLVADAVIFVNVQCRTQARMCKGAVVARILPTHTLSQWKPHAAKTFELCF